MTPSHGNPPPARSSATPAELLEQNRPQEALELAQQDQSPSGRYWSAVALRHLGRVYEAAWILADLQSADMENPQMLNSLGQCFTDLGEFDKAHECFRKAAWHGGAVRKYLLNLGCSYLRMGNWDHGWPAYEAGRFTESWSPIPGLPIWTGERQVGGSGGSRLLLQWEGGFGDMIQLSRYLPVLEQAGFQPKAVCLDSLIPLFTHAGMERFFHPASTPIQVDDYDLQSSILSLPALLGCTGNWPPPTDFRLTRTPSGFSGFCRLAGELQTQRPHRSIFRPPPWAWEMCSLSPDDEILRSPRFSDWLDTARFLCTLRYVVTVDTAIAHLSGSLGIPTLLLLPLRSDWRWGIGSSTTSLYPSIMIYRNPKLEWVLPESLIHDYEAQITG